MRNIEGSDWFFETKLKDIAGDQDYGAGRKAFSLSVKEISLKKEEELAAEAAENDAKGKKGKKGKKSGAKK